MRIADGPHGPGRFHALDAEGHRLADVNAKKQLEIEAVNGLAGRPQLDSRIAAYELEWPADGTSAVFPVALGHAAIMTGCVEFLEERVGRRRQRGPKPAGPTPPWNDIAQLLRNIAEEEGVTDENEPGHGWAEAVILMATMWLASGERPTQEAVAIGLGYSEQSAFARAIKSVGWPRLLALAAAQMSLWYDRLLGSVERDVGPTLDQVRLLKTFEGVLAKRQAKTLS